MYTLTVPLLTFVSLLLCYSAMMDFAMGGPHLAVRQIWDFFNVRASVVATIVGTMALGILESLILLGSATIRRGTRGVSVLAQGQGLAEGARPDARRRDLGRHPDRVMQVLRNYGYPEDLRVRMSCESQ